MQDSICSSFSCIAQLDEFYQVRPKALCQHVYCQISHTVLKLESAFFNHFGYPTFYSICTTPCYQLRGGQYTAAASPGGGLSGGPRTARAPSCVVSDYAADAGVGGGEAIGEVSGVTWFFFGIFVSVKTQ